MHLSYNLDNLEFTTLNLKTIKLFIIYYRKNHSQSPKDMRKNMLIVIISTEIIGHSYKRYLQFERETYLDFQTI